MPPKSRKRNTRKKYYSKMVFDGKTLSMESQEDNKPIKRKKITLKQLRRKIPIAAELINKYLDGKVPNSLHNHKYPQNTVSIYPVLPNPVDLGLIPPAMEEPPLYRDRGYGNGRITMRRKYRIPDESGDGEIMKLYVRDVHQGDRDVRDVRGVRDVHRDLGRNIGSLPYRESAIDTYF